MYDSWQPVAISLPGPIMTDVDNVYVKNGLPSSETLRVICQTAWLLVTSGASQGSILGLLLLIIYVDELVSVLFFRQTKISFCSGVNETAYHIMFLNVAYSAFQTIVHASPVNCTYQLGNAPIACQNPCKDLGVMFACK